MFPSLLAPLLHLTDWRMWQVHSVDDKDLALAVSSDQGNARLFVHPLFIMGDQCWRLNDLPRLYKKIKIKIFWKSTSTLFNTVLQLGLYRLNFTTCLKISCSLTYIDRFFRISGVKFHPKPTHSVNRSNCIHYPTTLLAKPFFFTF